MVSFYFPKLLSFSSFLHLVRFEQNQKCSEISHTRAEFLNLSDRNNSLKMIILLIYYGKRFLSSLSSFSLFLSFPPSNHAHGLGGVTSLTHPEADTLRCFTIAITVQGLLWTLSSLGKYLTSQLQLFSSHRATKATHNCLQLVKIGEDQKNDSRGLRFS